jgi:hypothetical protein
LRRANDHIKLAFWNVNGRTRNKLICDLAIEKGIDVFVVLESSSSSAATLRMLQRKVSTRFLQPITTPRRFHVFTRKKRFDLREVYADITNARLSILKLQLKSIDLNLGLVHMPSKLYFSDADQTAHSVALSQQLRQHEERVGHRRTILIGDFNMNPFEDGLTNASALNAVMTAEIAGAITRIVQGVQYPFFYNPMWGFFGDRTGGPPGTFHYRNAGYVSYDWNIFDQVLVRPDALRWFCGDLEVVTRTKRTSLATTNGRPNRDKASDHFPIMFELNE